MKQEREVDQAVDDAAGADEEAANAADATNETD